MKTFSLLFSILALTLPDAVVAHAQESMVSETADAEAAGGMGNAMSGYLIAQAAVQRGDANAALQGFLLALGEDTGNVGLQEDAFTAALVSGDVDTAVRISRVMPPVSDAKVMLWLTQLADAAKQNDVEAAQRYAENLETAVPELLQFKLLKAYVDVARGVAVESVVRELGTPEGLPSQQARQWYHEGRMWWQIGEVKQAEEAFARAYTLEPGAVFTNASLVQVYESEGQDKLALELVKRFEARNPDIELLGMNGKGPVQVPLSGGGLAQDISNVMFDFGVLIWAQGAELSARQIFALALWLQPDEPYVIYYSALVDEYAGVLPQARAKYARLVNDPMLGSTARLREAEVAYRLGDTDAARKSVERLLRENEDNVGALRVAAELAFEAGDFGKSARYYKRLLDAMQADKSGIETPEVLAEAWFTYGAALERDHDYEKAAQALQTSLHLAPNSPGVMNYLGYMWVEQGTHTDEAFNLLKQALAMAPQDGAIMDSVGWAYFKSGDVKAAQDYLQQAVQLAPDDATVVDHLGDVYAKQGRELEAGWQWQRALVLAKPGQDDELIHDVKRKLKR